MFIYCMDKKLKKKLVDKGFKLLKENEDVAVFVFNKETEFDFSKVDKDKILFTNILNFD